MCVFVKVVIIDLAVVFAWRFKFMKVIGQTFSGAIYRQYIRLADSGVLMENDYTFYWQGKGSGEHREYGVGFAVRNSLLSMIEPGSNDSERLQMRLNTTAGPVTFGSVYAPTMSATSDTKDEFYENLAAIMSSVANNEQPNVLGDVSAI